jgi:S1-C subfamily serine protease
MTHALAHGSARMRGAALVALLAWTAVALARTTVAEEGRAALNAELFDTVLALHAEVAPDARTAATLGTERRGAAIVIDADGLAVTMGYLVIEAPVIELTLGSGKKVPASVVALDGESGLALIRAALPLGVKPVGLGAAAGLTEGRPALILGPGGPGAALPVQVVSRRQFAGSWEYLLDDAIFTAPPHRAWSGAALIGVDGKLLGIGSLFVQDARAGTVLPGNMFVPVDRLTASMADLLATGRPDTPPRPWMGLTTQEIRGRLVVVNVPRGGPAERAGVSRGDEVTAVAGKPVEGLADFYREAWSLGPAGVEVPLTIRSEGAQRDVLIKSIDRYQYFKLGTTY